MKAVLTQRVSTQEQEADGRSLEAQEQRQIRYCESKGLTILTTFQYVESSTTGARKKFNEMIKFIESQKEKVALIADTVDRVQRSFNETTTLDKLRRAGKIEIHFLRENLIISENSKSHEIMMWDFAVMAAKAYVLSISDNVKRTFELKLNKGEFIRQAPVGYMNSAIVDESGKSKSFVKIDSVRAPFVKKAFELYATGNYSFETLAKVLKEDGLTNNKGAFKALSSSQVHLMIKNPFYYGEMEIKGKLFKHIYKPIIDKKLYDKCNEVRLGWRKQPFKYAGKSHVFKGVRCGNCGHTVSSDEKVKKKQTYLCCSHKYRGCKTAIRVNESTLIKQVAEFLQTVSVPESILPKVAKRIEERMKSDTQYTAQVNETVTKELVSINQQLETLLDMRLKLQINQSVYEKKEKELLERQKVLEGTIKDQKLHQDKFIRNSKELLELSKRIRELFLTSSNNEKKRRLIKFVCSNLTLRSTFLEFEAKRPFIAFINCFNHSNWLPR